MRGQDYGDLFCYSAEQAEELLHKLGYDIAERLIGNLGGMLFKDSFGGDVAYWSAVDKLLTPYQ